MFEIQVSSAVDIDEEVRMSKKLKHANCVRFHEFIETGNAYVLVMEYMPGGEIHISTLL
jgi:serine/threonine protein kinase